MYANSVRFCIFGMRAILLFCLLTGLFCSSGEGLRLLPFPDTGTNRISADNANFGGSLSFQFGAYQLDNNDGIYQLKFQARHLAQPAAGTNFSDVRFAAKLSPNAAAFIFEFPSAGRAATLGVPSGRAPPVSDSIKSRNSRAKLCTT